MKDEKGKDVENDAGEEALVVAKTLAITSRSSSSGTATRRITVNRQNVTCSYVLRDNDFIQHRTTMSENLVL